MEEWKKVEGFQTISSDAWIYILCPICGHEIGLEIDEEEKICKTCMVAIRARSYIEINKTIDEKKGEHS
jgi:hypothetical protein